MKRKFEQVDNLFTNIETYTAEVGQEFGDNHAKELELLSILLAGVIEIKKAYQRFSDSF